MTQVSQTVHHPTALAVGSEDTADIEANHESLWIYDLRFSLDSRMYLTPGGTPPSQ